MDLSFNGTNSAIRMKNFSSRTIDKTDTQDTIKKQHGMNEVA